MASNASGRTEARSLVQTAALVVGAVFLLIGVLGFVPGVTANYDSLEFAGHTSDAKLLGLFQVSILHNIVHLLFGVAGVLLSRSARTARVYLIGGGVVYALLFVYGLLVKAESDMNLVPLNIWDDLLHLVLAIGMVGLGVILGRRTDSYAGR